MNTESSEARPVQLGNEGKGSPYGPMPSPPKPSADLGIKESIPSPSADSGAVPSSIDALDIFNLSPLGAMNLLTLSVKSMISNDIDPPPTPPVSSPATPKCAVFEKSEEDQVASSQDGSFDLPVRGSRLRQEVPSHHKTPIGSPVTQPHEGPSASQPPQISLEGTLSEYDHQCLAMARTFQCKEPPPIPLNMYLSRIHQYCPLSTAVYLTAAHYIQGITHGLWTPTSLEKPMAVYVQITPRTVHRLVLGALRVATKALEDQGWPHSRFAGVGGVAKASLTRLEVAMCYLLDFKLFISEDALRNAAVSLLKDGSEIRQPFSATGIGNR